MKNLRTFKSALAMTAAASLLLAACGDDEADTTVDDVETTDEAMDEAMDEGTVESTLTLQPFGDACTAIPADGEGSSEGMSNDPAATAASNNPVLSTLVAAVGAAGLGDTVNGLEDATIFAPFNGAFDAFSEEELNAVLADTELLTTILTLHVVGDQNLEAQALLDAGTVTSVQGGELTVAGSIDEGVTVSSASTTANVICGNVQTANATVHIIDAVLMP